MKLQIVLSAALAVFSFAAGERLEAYDISEASEDDLPYTSSEDADMYPSSSEDSAPFIAFEEVKAIRSPARSPVRRPNNRPSRPSRPSSNRPNDRPSRPSNNTPNRPSRPSSNRPSSPSRPSNNSGSSNPFNEGRREGERAANQLWNRLGRSCAAAWGGFSSRVQREIRNKRWNSTGSGWRTDSFNRGARAGMQDVVNRKERECLHDNPNECIELGETAASEIAHKHCPSARGQKRRAKKNYKATCRRVAINQCQGGIFRAVSDECGRPNSDTLRRLQGDCQRQVDGMIRGSMSSQVNSE